jgi:hypothetical protein
MPGGLRMRCRRLSYATGRCRAVCRDMAAANSVLLASFSFLSQCAACQQREKCERDKWFHKLIRFMAILPPHALLEQSAIVRFRVALVILTLSWNASSIR